MVHVTNFRWGERKVETGFLRSHSLTDSLEYLMCNVHCWPNGFEDGSQRCWEDDEVCRLVVGGDDDLEG